MKSRDEVGELTRSFNLMTSQLQERLNLKEAMNLAMEVQQNLLPAAPPSVPGFDIAGRSLYCQETGGDYFDYILRTSPAGSSRLCVAVGDVVGHGISAALLMTTVRALLRCRLDQAGSIAEAVCDVNRLLYQDTAPSGSFVTLFLLEADSAAGSLEWVRAGHDPAWLYCAATDEVQDLGGPGMALGVDGACSYLSGCRSGLSADDVLLIGTDGIWETQNANSEKFGKETDRQDPQEPSPPERRGNPAGGPQCPGRVPREGAAGRRHHPSGPEVNGNRSGLSAWPKVLRLTGFRVRGSGKKPLPDCRRLQSSMREDGENHGASPCGLSEP